MRSAFKEWAVVVDVLGQGGQIVVLRKGGIREGARGFQVDHPSFFLFPTRFHQQGESVLPHARNRYDALLRSGSWPEPDILRIECHAHVQAWHRLDSLKSVRRLRGLHIWRDEVIEERYHWGRDANIYAMALRVFRLPHPVELPMIPEYGGCKSWVELARDIPIKDSIPVLDDAEFAERLREFTNRLVSSEPGPNAVSGGVDDPLE